MSTKTWIPTQTFGTRLAMIRRHLGWNQKEAAMKCGFDDGSWSNWERGAMPRNLPDVVEAVCKVTGADRDWLMWGSATIGDTGRLLSSRAA